MTKGEVQIPPDAPVLRPFRLLRFTAAWVHFVNTTEGEDAVIQPTADQVRDWLADDDAAGEAARTKQRPPSPLDGVEVVRDVDRDAGWRQIENQAKQPDRGPDGFTRPGSSY